MRVIMNDQITIKGARLHNLKNVTVSIPKNRLMVFTGLSGSGKSTLAFDTLHKEGQRQYMESLGLVTDNLSKPSVESITGLSPSISVDQRLANRSPRSTVGTVTEVFTYLRVLYARLGHLTCASCGADIPPSHEVEDDDAEADGRSHPCPSCGAAVPEMGMASFSFNKPAGACPTRTGLGVVHEARLEELVDSDRSVSNGAVRGWDAFSISHNSKTLTAATKHYGFAFDLSEDPRESVVVPESLESVTMPAAVLSRCAVCCRFCCPKSSELCPARSQHSPIRVSGSLRPVRGRLRFTLREGPG